MSTASQVSSTIQWFLGLYSMRRSYHVKLRVLCMLAEMMHHKVPNCYQSMRCTYTTPPECRFQYRGCQQSGQHLLVSFLALHLLVSNSSVSSLTTLAMHLATDQLSPLSLCPAVLAPHPATDQPSQLSQCEPARGPSRQLPQARLCWLCSRLQSSWGPWELCQGCPKRPRTNYP